MNLPNQYNRVKQNEMKVFKLGFSILLFLIINKKSNQTAPRFHAPQKFDKGRIYRKKKRYSRGNRDFFKL